MVETDFDRELTEVTNISLPHNHFSQVACRIKPDCYYKDDSCSQSKSLSDSFLVRVWSLILRSTVFKPLSLPGKWKDPTHPGSPP